MKKILFLLIVGIVSTFSQTMNRPSNDPARPVIGWDSLKSMIAYPEFARRGGVQGYSDVSVDVDTAGNVSEIAVSGYGIFRKNIEDAVKKVKWLPEITNGKPKATTVLLEIQFQLKPLQDMPKRRVIVIESELPNTK
jgi:outer membrane biosynthesis protein TonB